MSLRTITAGFVLLAGIAASPASAASPDAREAQVVAITVTSRGFACGMDMIAGILKVQ